MEILRDYSLAKECSFKCGGRACWYCLAQNMQEFCSLLKLHKNKKLFILGQGTNTIVKDCGFDGLVIHTKRLRDIEVFNNTVICDCGVSLFYLNNFLAEHSLGGLEWSYGIPGSIGGAAAMNAGAFGHDFSECILRLEVFKDDKVVIVDKNDIDFSYRRGYTDYPILRVHLQTTSSNSKQILENMENYYERRLQTQPLDAFSAGSVFKKQGEIIPSEIIDKLGLKGYSIGGAEISTVHSGFIINKNNATATDVVNLLDFIKNKVKIELGINLETEIIILE